MSSENLFKRLGKLMLVAVVFLSTFVTQLTVSKADASSGTNVDNAQATFYIPTHGMTGSPYNGTDTFRFRAMNTMTGELASSDDIFQVRTDQRQSVVHHNYSYHTVDPTGRYITMASHTTHGDRADLHFIDTVMKTSKTLKATSFWPVDVTFTEDGTQAIFIGRDAASESTGKLKVVSVDMSKLTASDPERESTWKKEIKVFEDITYPNRIVAVGDDYYVAYGQMYQYGAEVGKIAVLNTDTHTLEKTIVLDNNNGYEVGQVTQMFVSPEGGYIYAFSQEVMPSGRNQTMARIDTSTQSLEKIYQMNHENTVGDGIPPMLTLSPDGRSFYMSYGRDMIDVFSPFNGDHIDRITLTDLEANPDQPTHKFRAYQIGLSPDGKQLIVHLLYINTSKMRVIELDDSGLNVEDYNEVTLNNSDGTFYHYKPQVLNFPVQYLNFELEVMPDPIEVFERGDAVDDTWKQQLEVRKKLGTLVDLDVTSAQGIEYEYDVNAQPFIAGVNSAGEVQGFHYGTAQITVKVPGMEDKLVDVVVKPKLSGLTVDAPAEIFAGDESNLTVRGDRVQGSQVILDPEDVVYTSLTPSLLEVDQEGKVTAKSDGTVTESVYGRAQIKVESLGKQQTVDIDVKLAPFSGYELANEEVYVDLGASHTTVVNAVYGNWKTPYTGGNLTFDSSDTSIATVDANGTIEGLATGEAVITVTPPVGTPLRMTVHVTAPLTGIEFEQAQYTIFAREPLELLVKAIYSDGSWRYLNPGEGTYYGGNVEFEIDTPQNSNPTVTGYWEGTRTIYVTYNGFDAATTVTVLKKMYGLTFEPSRLTLDINETSELTVKKLYTGGVPNSEQTSSAEGVTYRIENPSIVSITGDTIKGLRAGTTMIYAEYEEDSITVTAESEITVRRGNTGGGNGGGSGNSGGNENGNNDGVTDTDNTEPTTEIPGNNGGNSGGNTDNQETPISFQDTNNHWAQSLINRGVQLGLVTGFEDGSFRPNDTVTRGQFAVILQRALGLEANDEIEFADQTSIPQWAKEAVSAAASAGLIVGYDDGTFRSDETISRAEIAVIIARVLNVKSEEPVSFGDASSIPAWAIKEISAITELGLINGRSNGSFDPNGKATRAEALVMVLRLLDYQQQN